MAIHKLQIDDFVTIDFELIAIHSSLEDYRLAYFINRELGILLEKSPLDIGITIAEGETSFSRFVYEEAESESGWSLIQNKNRVVSTQQDATSLFEADGYALSTNVFMLPEFKKVDYILKIEPMPCDMTADGLVEKLLAIKYITTAYAINHKKLKSKNNLIF